MNPTPTLSLGVQAAITKHTSGLRTGLPGRVESFDNATRMATVQPLILDGDVNENGDRVTVRLPVITSVPVIMPASGGIRIKWPVKVGDYVWLSFASSSLDQWLVKGGEVDPEDDRRHDINDAVAFPMHNPSSPTDASPLIEITDTEVRCGGSQSLALKSDVDALYLAFTTHVHPGVTVGPGVTGPTVATAIMTGTQVTKGA